MLCAWYCARFSDGLVLLRMEPARNCCVGRWEDRGDAGVGYAACGWSDNRRESPNLTRGEVATSLGGARRAR